MREIKFRIFDGVEMNYNVIGFDYNCGGIKRDIVTTFHEKYGVEFYQISDKFPLMQYTGLKDKNGKEIYEGDIVRFLDERESYTDCGYEYEEYTEVGEVIYNEQLQGWDITNRYCEREDVWHYMEYIEIIGNVYENKDLLEK